MPPYSGAHFQVLLRAPEPEAPSCPPLSPLYREWDSCITTYIPSLPNHFILGRIRNLDVELFNHYPSLEKELLSLDYTVRPYNLNTRMSVYADTQIKDRNLVQKLQDQLYETLKDDEEEVGWGLVAETQSEWMLVVKFDRQRYTATNPCPPTFESHGVKYNTIGYIIDNDVFITAAEKDVKRFHLSRPPWVLYKILDRTNIANYIIHLAEQKAEKVAEHKREKRRAKKIAEKKEKGTEQEKQGVLEAGGKDKRVGGQSYKKRQDEDAETDS
ncbi:unnamed protein product [Aureobasidium uvarum]|uniref:Uncharacterized protein n=1 Tax=Aureobasidium uvarum TaxID=2773716 RepID=A0A9N8KKA0_9PEZI|nr:unnamed protein product [Aureobasidium uvarum]